MMVLFQATTGPQYEEIEYDNMQYTQIAETAHLRVSLSKHYICTITQAHA